jgi:anti-anti-sigma factor
MACAPDTALPDTEPTIDVRRPRPHVALVVLGGEHDLASAPLVEHATEEALLTCSHLIVDLSPVQFIDSSIINLLVQLKKDADAKNCRFNLVMGTAPEVEHTLEICGVLPGLNRVKSVDEALDESRSLSRCLAGQTVSVPCPLEK